MNGWQRLAVVLTAPFCATGFAIGYEAETDSTFIKAPHLASLAKRKTSDEFYRRFWAETNWRDELDGCNEDTITAEPLSSDPPEIIVKCERKQSYRIQQGVTFAAIPAGVVYALVLIVGWVVAGFRQPIKTG